MNESYKQKQHLLFHHRDTGPIGNMETCHDDIDSSGLRCFEDSFHEALPRCSATSESRPRHRLTREVRVVVHISDVQNVLMEELNQKQNCIYIVIIVHI